MSEGRSKRERKSVEHFRPASPSKEGNKPSYDEGHGTKLLEIPNFVYRTEKLTGTSSEMIDLHWLLYKTKGKALTRKKDIKNFSGFSKHSMEEEREKAKGRLGKFTILQINTILDLFDLPRGTGEEGHKEAKISRIAQFLEKPEKLSKKDIGAEAARKREKAAKAKKRADGVQKKSLSKGTPAKDSIKKSKKEMTTPAKDSAKKTKKEKSAPFEKGGNLPDATQAEDVAVSGRKRKAADAEHNSEKKVKQSLEKKPKTKLASPTAHPNWPSHSQLTVDVKSLLNDTSIEQLTLKQIFVALGEKYDMPVDTIKKQRSALKAIVEELQAAEPEIEEAASVPKESPAACKDHAAEVAPADEDTEMKEADQEKPEAAVLEAEPKDTAAPAEAVNGGKSPEMEAPVAPEAASEKGDEQPTAQDAATNDTSTVLLSSGQAPSEVDIVPT